MVGTPTTIQLHAQKRRMGDDVIARNCCDCKQALRREEEVTLTYKFEQTIDAVVGPFYSYFLNAIQFSAQLNHIRLCVRLHGQGVRCLANYTYSSNITVVRLQQDMTNISSF